VKKKETTQSTSDPLLAFREEFPILAKTTYLVSNSLGPMPRTVPEKLAEYARDWGELGVMAWNRGWWEQPVEVGNEIAPLINAGSGEIVMMPNVTIAQTAVLSAIDFPRDRDTVVMTELDFPSVRYAYAEMARRLGARVVVVRSDDGITIDPDKLLSAIDERTRLVAVSHVLFRSAYIMDANAICARAHDLGALVSLDSFHAVGVVPVDVKRSRTDFLTGGALKWLCGGPGACFLYVSPAVRDQLKPALNGTRVIPALYAAAEGPKLLRRAGITAIREKSLRLTSRLMELADARGYKVNAPRAAERRGGTVALDVPHGYEVTQHLLSRNVLVDYRVGAGIRIAPHFFTSEEELEFAVSEIETALESGSWRRFSEKIAVVT